MHQRKNDESITEGLGFVLQVHFLKFLSNFFVRPNMVVLSYENTLHQKECSEQQDVPLNNQDAIDVKP